jgi:hypothetical protein
LNKLPNFIPTKIPTIPPTPLNTIEEKEKSELPQSAGMYAPIVDPINTQIQTIVLVDIRPPAKL